MIHTELDDDVKEIETTHRMQTFAKTLEHAGKASITVKLSNGAILYILLGVMKGQVRAAMPSDGRIQYTGTSLYHLLDKVLGMMDTKAESWIMSDLDTINTMAKNKRDNAEDKAREIAESVKTLKY